MHNDLVLIGSIGAVCLVIGIAWFAVTLVKKNR